MHNGFARDLALFGPGGRAGRLDPAQAQSYCTILARTHYENFSVASVLLPRRLLRHFHAVYAYCRWADDLADETAGGNQALELLAWWRQELLACYAGKPRHPVTVALVPTIRQFDIPPEPFLDLLRAFEQDQTIKRYDSYEQLLGYCRNSANPVGHLVLYLCEAFDAANATFADNICTALQLTNFWQDVARDFAIGRVYLPAEDRRRFSYSDQDLEAQRYNTAFAELMRFEIERTRQLFREGLPLLERVPADVRADIELFARGGLAVLRKIEQLQYNVWQTRPALSKWDKAALVGRVCWRKLAQALT
jgi:squalene synthase HpnC